jgi:hypothetical protein
MTAVGALVTVSHMAQGFSHTDLLASRPCLKQAAEMELAGGSDRGRIRILFPGHEYGFGRAVDGVLVAVISGLIIGFGPYRNRLTKSRGHCSHCTADLRGH